MKLDKIYQCGRLYGRIVHSVRKNGKVRNVLIKYLGAITEEEAERIKDYLRLDPTVNPDALVVDINKTEVIDSKMHGNIALCYSLVKELGLSRIIRHSIFVKKNKHEYASWINIMLINRLCDPMSKYALLDWIPKTTLLYFMGMPNRELHENLFYRAMDKLWDAKDTVELKVWREVTSKITNSAEPTFYKDLTTTYYTGNCCEIASYGRSKEHFSIYKPVKWGIIVTPEGFPVTLEVYPGNRSDKTTVIDTIKRLKRHFGLQKGIVIGDRGLVSDDNCRKITHECYEYIFAEPNKNVEEIIEDALRMGLKKIEYKNDDYDDKTEWFFEKGKKIPETIEVCEMEKYGERWIVTKSNYKKFTDEEKQKRILRNAELVIKWAHGEQIQVKKKKKVERQSTLRRRAKGEEKETEVKLTEALKNSRPPKDPQDLIKSIATKMAQFGGNKYYDYRYENGLVITRIDEQIEKDKRYFGIWVLRTTTRKGCKEIIKMYRAMQIIEQGFRVIKSVLKVDPLNHRKAHRVKSHLFICVLAYLVEMIIEMKLKVKGIKLSAKKMVEKFDDVTATKELYPALKREVWKIKKLDKVQEEIMNMVVSDDYYITKGWGRL